MEPTKISSPQGTQPAHAARPRSAAQGTDTTDAAGSGGFLALLAALGDGPLEGAPLGTVGADQDATALLPDAGKEAVDAAAMAAWQGLLGGPSAQGHAASDTASLAAADAVLGGGGRANPLAGALTGADGVPQGLVAETTMLDTSGDLKGGQQPGAAPGFGRAFSRMQSNALAQKTESIESLGSRSAAVDGGKLQLSPQAFTPTVAAAFHAVGERVTGAAAGERSTAGTPGLGAWEAGAPAVDGLLAATASARSAESSGGRAGDGQQGATTWGDGMSTGGPQEAGAVDGTVFTDPAQAGLEEQVADQVAYWVHQKTQNAELTLTRDGQPVEVSVSLSGNEAHVSFRSDQAQTRDMLDRSMAQLSDLLRSEGLVLSGMSVGTSAGQGAGSGSGEQQRQREGARQGQVISTAPAGTASLQRSGGSPERAVDIFV
ncbi:MULTISPECIES: flagellar hook-length control protein FliK [unclassified Acidovorax]|uniref:flagellar hook-length control protein FliK n=1 Tax=unclassified Acidovorax TaxID=2684926 RepID=UPI000B12C01D|nr:MULTISPECIES: flagellar hook-length control protein FliK [unclassified Acidovorax]